MKSRQVQETERTTSDTAHQPSSFRRPFHFAPHHPPDSCFRSCLWLWAAFQACCRRTSWLNSGRPRGSSALQARWSKTQFEIESVSLIPFMNTWTKQNVLTGCKLQPLKPTSDICVSSCFLAAKCPRPKLIVSKRTSFLHLGAKCPMWAHHVVHKSINFGVPLHGKVWLPLGTGASPQCGPI